MKKTITVGVLLAAMAGVAIAGSVANGGGHGTINGGGHGTINGVGINGPSGAAPAYAIDGVAARNGHLVFGGR